MNFRFISRTLLFIACVSAWVASVHAAEKLQFNRDIRPILSDNCFNCHGPDSAARKGDLRLDQREAAVASKAILPNEPDASEVIKRILSADKDEVMPPPTSHKTLTAKQKDTLKQWIAEGAEYQPHWSFLPIVKPAVPQPKQKDWVRNPVDAFVLAKLESLGLSPAAEADRRTLIRRVALDLTGIPPSIQDLNEAVNDTAPNWYEKFVDKLMASQAWGEHRGRYWLDAARYADTHGIHFDNYREIWAYREWVVRAFNQNMKFDQFTIEQLAGDLLPNRTLDQQIASGFNRCNTSTNEGGIIDEEYLVLYTRDRTETTATVWLGLSAGCCVCHDHKFDPITQKEFYSLSAFFNNTTIGAKDGNIKDSPPVVPVVAESDRQRFSELEQQIPGVKQQIEQRKNESRGDFEAWQQKATVESLGAANVNEGLVFAAPLSEGTGKTTKVKINGVEQEAKLADNVTWQDATLGTKAIQIQGAAAEFADVGDFDAGDAFSCSAWVKLQPNDTTGAIVARMDKSQGYRGWDFWVQQRRVGTHIVSTWQANALKVVAKDQIPAGQWTLVTVTYDGSKKASGVKVYYNGKPQATNVEADALSETTKVNVPLKIGQRHDTDPLSAAGVQDLRIYKKVLQLGEVQSLAKSSQLVTVLAKSAEQRTDKEKGELFSWWLATNDAKFKELTEQITKLEQEQAGLKGRGTIAYVMNEKNGPAMAHVLFRGDYDKRRDEVKPETPAILSKFPEDLPRNRLGLAQWLLRPEHPLTTRVTVNRFWQELFGQGICRSTGDLGGAGELPANQELLDWLATEFREQAWDVKKFFKMLVMSNTYRQSAVVTKEKLDKDLTNRFNSRGPRFRMDGEMIRDYALAASGLLVNKIGGPSVKPYQPDGVWEAVAMPESNTRFYKRDSGEGLYRRSMYTFWKRAAPPASMEIFNAPNRELCTVKRDRTNTPLQALCTLNDPQFVEAARALAQTALLQGGDTVEKRLDFIAQRALSRGLKPAELMIMTNSVKELAAHYQANAEDAKSLVAFGEAKPDPKVDVAELAAWTMLVNEFFNLDEVLNK